MMFILTRFVSFQVQSPMTHTQIICQVAAGEGADKLVVVTVLSQSSAENVRFSYDSPNIATVVPAFDSTSGGSIIRITGTVF
jgi:hypothetical protein